MTETPSLAPRELEVLRLVAEGNSNHAIASKLGLGETTVKAYLTRVMRKVGARDRASAVHRAWQLGILGGES